MLNVCPVSGYRIAGSADPTAAHVASMKITFEPFVDDGTRRFIVDGIDMYNISVTAMPEYAPVNLVLRGECGDVLGGLLGQLWGGWLQVSYLWVSAAARGQGHGTRLLSNAHDYARSKGAVGATLETFSFQARPFYERLGYELCGTIEGYPPGHAKFFLRKSPL
jgi:GNAT superfamily N-acetyltransferase